MNEEELCYECDEVLIDGKCINCDTNEDDCSEEDDSFEIWRHSKFAEPGGNSALRAASKDNPRNLPCPTCEKPNCLTPEDQARGYQCNSCADRDECGY